MRRFLNQWGTFAQGEDASSLLLMAFHPINQTVVNIGDGVLSLIQDAQRGFIGSQFTIGGTDRHCTFRFLVKDSFREPALTDAFMKSTLADIGEAFAKQSILLGAPHFFRGGDLPRDHMFSDLGVMRLRRDTKSNNPIIPTNPEISHGFDNPTNTR